VYSDSIPLTLPPLAEWLPGGLGGRLFLALRRLGLRRHRQRGRAQPPEGAAAVAAQGRLQGCPALSLGCPCRTSPRAARCPQSVRVGTARVSIGSTGIVTQQSVRVGAARARAFGWPGRAARPAIRARGRRPGRCQCFCAEENGWWSFRPRRPRSTPPARRAAPPGARRSGPWRAGRPRWPRPRPGWRRSSSR